MCVCCVSRGGCGRGDPDIYIPALPPLSGGISPGIFIHCTCWLPASRCRLEDATLGQGQSSKFPTFPPPPPRLACVFPNPKRAGRKAPSFWLWRDLGVREMGLPKESCWPEFGMMAQVWLLGCSAAPAQPQCRPPGPPSRSQLREDSPSPVTTCGNPDAEDLCW